MKKAFSVRIEENTVNRLKFYCAELGKSEADFMSEAIEKYCDALRLERSGGMCLTIPNPQNSAATEAEKETAAAILSEAANDLSRNCSGLNFGLHYIAGFALERFYNDSEEAEKTFKENLYKDI